MSERLHMSQVWFVAKYVRDLRRREPRNVGILLFSDDRVLARFLAEDPSAVEKIDGRSIRDRRKIGSPVNYRAWVHYWRRAADKKPRSELLRRASDDNYYLEHGGQLVAGPEIQPEELLNQLYFDLVAEPSTAAEEAPPEDRRESDWEDRVRRALDLMVGPGGLVDPTQDERVTSAWRSAKAKRGRR